MFKDGPVLAMGARPTAGVWGVPDGGCRVGLGVRPGTKVGRWAAWQAKEKKTGQILGFMVPECLVSSRGTCASCAHMCTHQIQHTRGLVHTQTQHTHGHTHTQIQHTQTYTHRDPA